ncbi:hypothetical protein [Aliiroseovarius sp. YM-037]|uniref:hypothetical protein n=1 Tax=Aliiroseovarius sp. YM-037 TaxID=3341728 RepID=UPI003A7FAE64
MNAAESVQFFVPLVLPLLFGAVAYFVGRRYGRQVFLFWAFAVVVGIGAYMLADQSAGPHGAHRRLLILFFVSMPTVIFAIIGGWLGLSRHGEKTIQAQDD